ncbi:unnamed protein product, partial [Rotaria sordida]
LLNNRSPVG